MATTYYRYNDLTRDLTAEPRYIRMADGRTIVNPTAEQYATLRDAYLKGEDAPLPEPREGKVVEYGGYALGDSDHLWHKQWVLVDAPPPPPRTFSKLRIVAALTKADVWAQVKAYIEQAGLYDLYLAAQDFARTTNTSRRASRNSSRLLVGRTSRWRRCFRRRNCDDIRIWI